MKQSQREKLGRLVRAVWVNWAFAQPEPKASWIAPWEGLSEPDKEVDRRIGERLFDEGRNWVYLRLFYILLTLAIIRVLWSLYDLANAYPSRPLSLPWRQGRGSLPGVGEVRRPTPLRGTLLRFGCGSLGGSRLAEPGGDGQ